MYKLYVKHPTMSKDYALLVENDYWYNLSKLFSELPVCYLGYVESETGKYDAQTGETIEKY